MKQTGYIEWIERSFPECEVRIMSDLLIESIAVVQLFVVPGDERCQVVRTDSVRSPVVHSDQEAFFDQYDNFGCSPAKAELRDGDVFYEMNDPTTAAIFVDKSPDIQTYAQDGIMILRLKDKANAQFLVWYLSLEQVTLEIINSHSNSEWAIETLEVPVADYFNNDTFLNLLEETADAENRIARNAGDMLDRLRTMRERVVYEIPDILAKSKSIKK